MVTLTSTAIDSLSHDIKVVRIERDSRIEMGNLHSRADGGAIGIPQQVMTVGVV